ncbi:MAG TPA: hypothetical protein VJ300_00455 [Thermoplasmata archaeon]|nr:hypothetical protein [Thermoplasmata archaeon]
MTTYFGLWKANTSIPPPPTPGDQVKQQEAFDALLRTQLKSGRIREVHAFLEGGAGYFITGDVSDEEVFQDLSVWSPYITFELHRTIPFPKASEIVVRALKNRSGKA